MGTVTVWTKQHRGMLETLDTLGRYTAKKEIVRRNEESSLTLEAYDWLAAHLPNQNRPTDADYPVWLSFSKDAAMLLSPDTVLLELEVEESLITRLNVAKWGAVLNFSYLPQDDADGRRHRKMLADYGLSDAGICMSRFYPELRQEIHESWMRLFDDSVQLGGDHAYGLIWEVKREWIRSVTR